MQRQLPELHKGSNQSTQVLRSAAHVLLHRFVRTPHGKRHSQFFLDVH